MLLNSSVCKSARRCIACLLPACMLNCMHFNLSAGRHLFLHTCPVLFNMNWPSACLPSPACLLPPFPPSLSSLPTLRELEEVQSRNGDESWVPQSSMFKLAQAQLAEAHSLLEARAKQLAALQHDKDELLRRVETKAQQAEVGGCGV